MEQIPPLLSTSPSNVALKICLIFLSQGSLSSEGQLPSLSSFPGRTTKMAHPGEEAGGLCPHSNSAQDSSKVGKSSAHIRF